MWLTTIWRVWISQKSWPHSLAFQVPCQNTVLVIGYHEKFSFDGRDEAEGGISDRNNLMFWIFLCFLTFMISFSTVFGFFVYVCLPQFRSSCMVLMEETWCFDGVVCVWRCILLLKDFYLLLCRNFAFSSLCCRFCCCCWAGLN